MKNLKLIGGVICVILAIGALIGASGRPSMIAGTFIWGACAYFLFKSANKVKK